MDFLDLFFIIFVVIPFLIFLSFLFYYFYSSKQDEKEIEEKQKEQKEFLKKITKEINNETLKNYTVEKLISDSLPINGFCAELEETILNGLKEEKYKSIGGKYYWINTIAEYENFTVEKTDEILEQLFAANKIELVYLHTNDNKRLLCCKLKQLSTTCAGLH